MLRVNMAAEARMLESAEDMTAADTEPSPKNDTHYTNSKQSQSYNLYSIQGLHNWYGLYRNDYSIGFEFNGWVCL